MLDMKKCIEVIEGNTKKLLTAVSFTFSKELEVGECVNLIQTGLYDDIGMAGIFRIMDEAKENASIAYVESMYSRTSISCNQPLYEISEGKTEIKCLILQDELNNGSSIKEEFDAMCAELHLFNTHYTGVVADVKQVDLHNIPKAA